MQKNRSRRLPQDPQGPRRFLFFLYYLGLILGAAYAARHRGEQGNYLLYFADSFVRQHCAASFLPVFSLSFLAALGLDLLLLLGSFCCFGAPFILLLPLLRGIGCGCLTGLLLVQHGGRGVLFCALLLWLPAGLQSLALLLFAAETFTGSVRLFRCALLHRSSAALIDPRGSLQAFLLYTAAALAGAVLEGVLAMLLGAVFQF